MDLQDLVNLHFPDLRINVMNRIVENARNYATNTYDGEIESEMSKSYISRVSEKLVRCIITQTSRKENQDYDIESILTGEDDYRDQFPVIFTISNSYADLFELTIVPTCRNEFNKTDDWRVKESSLLTTQISSIPSEQRDFDCIK